MLSMKMEVGTAIVVMGEAEVVGEAEVSVAVEGEDTMGLSLIDSRMQGDTIRMHLYVGGEGTMDLSLIGSRMQAATIRKHLAVVVAVGGEIVEEAVVEDLMSRSRNKWSLLRCRISVCWMLQNFCLLDVLLLFYVKIISYCFFLY